MDVKSYESNDKIEFVGSNNWNALLFFHLTLLTILGFAAYNSHEFLSETAIARGIQMLIVLVVVSISYNSIKNARNPKYIKEKIKFTKEGIFINHTKNIKSEKLIKSESIKEMKIIFDGTNFKFMLFGLDKPYFEFTLPIDSNFNPDKFLQDISELLNLNILEGAQFEHRTIIELHREKEFSSKISSKYENETNSKQKKKHQEKVKIDTFRPKSFYTYKKNDKTIIEARSKWTEKITVSSKNRIVSHKMMFAFRKQYRFNEIAELKFEINYRTERISVSHVEGKLFIITVNNKKKGIFTVINDVQGQIELIELEIFKDLEHLVKILNKEIKGNYT